MKIDIAKVRSGLRDGEVVYVCDYRYNSFSSKPIRHIKPTKVLIRSNNKIKKNIYYSESHFVKLNKKGEETSTIISLFDNTGFRSNTGTPLAVFDNVRECQLHYIKQCEIVQEDLEAYLKEETARVGNKIADLNKDMAKLLGY